MISSIKILANYSRWEILFIFFCWFQLCTSFLAWLKLHHFPGYHLVPWPPLPLASGHMFFFMFWEVTPLYFWVTHKQVFEFILFWTPMIIVQAKTYGGLFLIIILSITPSKERMNRLTVILGMAWVIDGVASPPFSFLQGCISSRRRGSPQGLCLCHSLTPRPCPMEEHCRIAQNNCRIMRLPRESRPQMAFHSKTNAALLNSIAYL